MIICLEIFTNLLQFLSKVKQIMKGDEPHNVILLSAKTIIKAVSNLERGAQLHTQYAKPKNVHNKGMEFRIWKAARASTGSQFD